MRAFLEIGILRGTIVDLGASVVQNALCRSMGFGREENGGHRSEDGLAGDGSRGGVVLETEVGDEASFGDFELEEGVCYLQGRSMGLQRGVVIPWSYVACTEAFQR